MANFNKPVVVALASYGMSGEIFHAPVICSLPELYLKTVLERSSERSNEKYSWVKVVKTYEEILFDDEIELVVVNTPNQLHFPMTKQALEAGKHVIVEKPFTVSVEEGEELIALAQSKGLLLSVFHSKRYETDFLTLQHVLKENLVGIPVEIHWHYDRYRTHVTHKRWKEENVPGAGILYDLGVHLIDSVTQLLGQPVNVTAHLRTLRKDAGSPDYFHIRLGFQGVDVYLHSSTLVREKGPHIVLHGSTGSFIKYSNDPQEEQSKNGIKPDDANWGVEKESQWGILHTEINNKIVHKSVESRKGSYVQYYQDMSAAVRHNGVLPVTPEQALQNIRIIRYAMQSHVEQRTITL